MKTCDSEVLVKNKHSAICPWKYEVSHNYLCPLFRYVDVTPKYTDAICLKFKWGFLSILILIEGTCGFMVCSTLLKIYYGLNHHSLKSQAV